MVASPRRPADIGTLVLTRPCTSSADAGERRAGGPVCSQTSALRVRQHRFHFALVFLAFVAPNLIQISAFAQPPSIPISNPHIQRLVSTVRLHDAEALARDLLTNRSPVDPDAIIDLAAVIGLSGRTSDAVTILQQALEASSDRSCSHANLVGALGVALLHDGRGEEAEERLRHAIEHSRSHDHCNATLRFDLHTALAYAFRANGSPLDAIEQFIYAFKLSLAQYGRASWQHAARAVDLVFGYGLLHARALRLLVLEDAMRSLRLGGTIAPPDVTVRLFTWYGSILADDNRPDEARQAFTAAERTASAAWGELSVRAIEVSQLRESALRRYSSPSSAGASVPNVDSDSFDRARALAAAGHYAESIEMLRRLASSATDTRQATSLLLSRSEVLLEQSRFEEAIIAASEALQRGTPDTPAADHTDLFRARLIIAEALLGQGNVLAARSVLGQMNELSQGDCDPLARRYRLLRVLASAEVARIELRLTETLSTCAAVDLTRSDELSALGSELRRQGRHAEAANRFRESLLIQVASRGQQNLRRILTGFDELEARHQAGLISTSEFESEAYDLLLFSPPNVLGVVSARTRQGAALVRANEFALAEEHMRGVWPDSLPRVGVEWLEYSSILSRVDAQAGHHGQAASRLLQALNQALRSRPTESFVAGYYQLAEHQLAAGQYDESVASWMRALRNESLYRNASAYGVGLSQLYAITRRAPEADALVIQALRVLARTQEIEALAATHLLSSRSWNVDLLRVVARNATASSISSLVEAHARLADLVIHEHVDPSAIRRAQEHADLLWREVSQSPESAPDRELTRLMDGTDLGLGHQESLVQIDEVVFAGNASKRLIGVVVFRGRRVISDLGEADSIGSSVQGLVAMLDGHLQGSRTEQHERAAELYDRVLRPLAPFYRGAQRIYLVPDGALARIPWSALVTGFSEDGQPRYLIDEPVELVMMSSARDLTRPMPPPSRGAPLVLAPFATRSDSDRGLPGSLAEAQRIARYLGTQPRLDEAASYEALREATERQPPRILHLATHGFAHEADRRVAPLAVVGLDFGPTEAARIPASRIALELDLRGTEVVTLSACETGLGTYAPGQDLASTRQAFHIAGARHVVASLWEVPDESAAFFMERFYGYLASAVPVADAFRRAVQDTRAQPRFRLPRHWAAFTLSSVPGRARPATNATTRTVAADRPEVGGRRRPGQEVATPAP